MTMLTQRAVVAIEAEAVEGTAETLVAADGMLVFNPTFKPNIEMNERDPVRASLSPMVQIPGKRNATFGFEIEMVGASAGAGNAPHYSDALKACGFGETIVGGTSVTYAPASSAIPSATIGMWVDGKKYLGWGARGNVTFTLAAGKPGMMKFEFQCADWSETDEALLAGVTLESALPPVFASVTLTLDAFSTCVLEQIEINVNNTVAMRPSVLKESGNISALITNRKPGLNFTTENILKATYDFLGKWRAGTTIDLDAAWGSAAGNTFGLSCPKVQLQDTGLEDAEGKNMLTIDSLLILTSGDDEISIAIT